MARTKRAAASKRVSSIKAAARTTKRVPTTIHLDPRVAKAAKVKAALTDRSLSDVVGEAIVRDLARDQADLELIRKRRGEPRRDYEELVAEMKRDGLL